MDLVFVLDSSTSIRETNPDGIDNWTLLLQFIINVVDRLPVGENAARVGVVRFADSAENMFYLNTFSTKTAITNEIESIVYTGGSTNTSDGLRVMRTEQFVTQNGDRANADNVAIIITDGASTSADNMPLVEAQLAWAAGIRTYSVGISNAVNVLELKGMSSLPQEENQQYWTSSDFQVLDGIVDTLVEQTCQTPPPATSPPGMQASLLKFQVSLHGQFIDITSHSLTISSFPNLPHFYHSHHTTSLFLSLFSACCGLTYSCSITF